MTQVILALISLAVICWVFYGGYLIIRRVVDTFESAKKKIGLDKEDN